MKQAPLDLCHECWLDRLADLYDAHDLFPDMRPVGEIVAAIVAQIAPLIGRTQDPRRGIPRMQSDGSAKLGRGSADGVGATLSVRRGRPRKASGPDRQMILNLDSGYDPPRGLR
jgi:hypothetical protein